MRRDLHERRGHGKHRVAASHHATALGVLGGDERFRGRDGDVHGGVGEERIDRERLGGILAVGGGIGDWEGNGREEVGLAARDRRQPRTG